MRRAVGHLAAAVACAMVLLLVREWAYGTTYRLFLDQRVNAEPSASAMQRFDLEAGRVVPQLIVHDDVVAFAVDIGRASRVRATVRPEGAATYTIRVRRGDVEQTLCGGSVNGVTEIGCAFPLGIGTLEIVTHGQAIWSDLRIERSLHVIPQLAVLAVIAVGALVFRRRGARRATGGQFWPAALTIACSTFIALAIVEVTLRAVGSRLSAGISAARHDLGEQTNDPRWQQTSRYGQRLAIGVDATNEWRYGDIVRMGFLPPSVVDARVHRYRFHTDEEGFRNARTRPTIGVAALGDSFTDAQTMRVEDGWPMQLERLIGEPVQNYGTSGFGPQQELRVLEDFALPHRPKLVVLAFFAGNDIRDAEVFERAGRTDTTLDHPQLGWPTKRVITRADRLFLMSAVQAARATWTAREVAADRPAEPGGAASRSFTDRQAGPSFNQGMFTVPGADGRTLRWAFMPPYLGWLSLSEDLLAARRGWQLADQNITAMARASSAAGAEFVVMLIPSKAQVYLPLAARTFDRAELERALQSVLKTPTLPNVEWLLRNRLAVNALISRLCVREHIPLLDLTPVLQERVEAGENMYFPDDSHLNEAGEAVVASTLARCLGRFPQEGDGFRSVENSDRIGEFSTDRNPSPSCGNLR